MNLSKYYPRPTASTPLKPGECFLAQIWISYLKLFRIDRSSYPEFDASDDYADFCAVLRLALARGGDVRFWERMVVEDGKGLDVEGEGEGKEMKKGVKKGVEYRVEEGEEEEEEVVVVVVDMDMESQRPATQSVAVSGPSNGVGVDRDRDRLQAPRQNGRSRASINGEICSHAPLLRQSGDGYTPPNRVCEIDLHEQTQQRDVATLLLNGEPVDGESPMQQPPSERNGDGNGIGVIPSTFPNKVIDDIDSDDVGQRVPPPAYHPPDSTARPHVDAADTMTIRYLPNPAPSPAPPEPPASPVGHGNRVNVYIGRGDSQVVYNMAFKPASGSEIIRNALVTKDGVTEARPSIFEDIEAEDFEIVKSFLEMKEYSPTLVATRKQCHHLEVNMDISLRFITHQLEGLVSVEDHEKELMRTGYIYLLALKLSLPEMQDLCLRKILLGFPVIGLPCMLGFIGYVLQQIPSEPKPPAIRAEEEGPLRDFYYRERDPLSEYLVEWMAVHMSDASATEGFMFWQTMENVDGLKHAVMLRAAEIELEGVTRKFRGGIGVKDWMGGAMMI
ncbi:hypothetical protein FQN50_006290 [Emmonsiellopsis sp. PD_5]|nr:hypothetical protein FQN50_006290 [Emmonsiellopsis sp. PD_5]